MSSTGTSTPPKITFFTLPAKRPETPGMATPPLRPPGGVPFMWEEAPGKPKVKREPRLPPGPVVKSLDPPPRKVAAPTTNVLDGPSESSIQSSSFGEGRSRSFRFLSSISRSSSSSGGSSSFGNKKGDKYSLCFREKERKRRISVGVLDTESSTPSSSNSSSSSSSSVFYPLSLSSSSQYCEDEVVSEERIKGQEGIKETKVTISRMRRSRSFQSILSLHASSHFWACINGGMKHWPWRRSHNKA